MSCFKKTPESSLSKMIDKALKQDQRRIQKEINFLLLGTGESGKSTLAKQMKILHLNGFTEQEKISFVPTIFSNTISSMKTLVNACQDAKFQNRFPLDPQNVDLAQRFKLVKPTELTQEVAEQIKILLQDSGIKAALANSSQFQFLDSAPFYFQNVDRIAAANYVPSEEDILKSRQMTTGIIETEWQIGSEHFKMIDVGGQRNHRNKWIHCFDKVTAVIFCIAISEYDQMLREDETTNRMHESLALFETLINSTWFCQTSFIIFFNKMDLFEEKIKKTDLSCCFPEYTGGKNADVAKQYIQQRFLALDKNRANRKLLPYFTCATDTNQIRTIFDGFKVIVVNDVMTQSGLVPGLDA